MRSLGDLFYNFHWIEQAKAARSSQAYAGMLAPFLRNRRIRAVINLRGPNPQWRWWRSERRVCAKLGIEHRDVMLSSKRLPTRKMVTALLDAFDEAPRPFLLKCSGGQDRTSFAAALYIVHTKGWAAIADAQKQFARWPYLHMPHRRQRWLKLFLVFAREDAGAKPLRAWIAERYIPESFKAWLEARGEAQSFHGLYDPALGL
jgi:protein tyrosine/serine phosphatase